METSFVATFEGREETWPMVMIFISSSSVQCNFQNALSSFGWKILPGGKLVRNERRISLPLNNDTRLEKPQRSDVQLSERLASLGITGAQLRTPETPRTMTVFLYRFIKEWPIIGTPLCLGDANLSGHRMSFFAVCLIINIPLFQPVTGQFAQIGPPKVRLG